LNIGPTIHSAPEYYLRVDLHEPTKNIYISKNNDRTLKRLMYSDAHSRIHGIVLVQCPLTVYQKDNNVSFGTDYYFSDYYTQKHIHAKNSLQSYAVNAALELFEYIDTSPKPIIKSVCPVPFLVQDSTVDITYSRNVLITGDALCTSHFLTGLGVNMGMVSMCDEISKVVNGLKVGKERKALFEQYNKNIFYAVEILFKHNTESWYERISHPKSRI
jgi:hypothetical protein